MNMFEIQREIFTKAATAVLAISPSCRITNSFEYAPPAFPTVAIVMSDHSKESTRDSSHADNFREVTLVCDAYSNKTDGKKLEAESLMQAVIDTLLPYNFNMVSCKPASNMNTASIYRITATFTATVEADGTIYTK